MKKAFTLLTLLLCSVCGLAVSAETTHYKPGARKASLEANDVVFIYNTCFNGSEDRTGFIYNAGNSINVQKEKPYSDAANYHYEKAAGASVWKVVSVTEVTDDSQYANGTFIKVAIKSLSTDKYLAGNGSTSSDTEQYIYLRKWTDTTLPSAWKAGVKTETGNGTTKDATSIGEDDCAYLIASTIDFNSSGQLPNTTFWNCNPNTWARWGSAHPYVFYTAVDCSTEYQAMLNTAKAALQTAFDTADTNYNGISYTLSGATDVTLTADGNLLCNAEQTKTGTGDSEMTLSNLVDDDNNTSFHSSWQQNKNTAPSTWHFLQVNLTEAASLVSFTYRTRHNGGPHPTIIEIQCSSDDVNYVSVATFNKDVNGLPQANGTPFNSRVIGLPFAAKHIRYVVKGNSSDQKLNGYPYFALSAFGFKTYTYAENSASDDANLVEFSNFYESYYAAAVTVLNTDNANLLLSDVTAVTNSLANTNTQFAAYSATKDLDFITTDPAAPKLFAIKSGRTAQKNDGTNWMWTIKPREGGKIKIESIADEAAISNNVLAYWSLQRVAGTGYLKLVPYIEPGQPMGYVTVGDGANKLTNVSTTDNYASDLYEYAATGVENYPHALKPAGQNTYVSNHGGTGNYMGFYNDLTDKGTIFAIVSQSELSNISSLRSLETTWKALAARPADSKFGTTLNTLNTDYKTAYDDAVNTTTTLLTTTASTATPDDISASETKFTNLAGMTLEMNQPTPGKFYRFKNVRHQKRLRSNVSGNVLQCGDPADNGRESIFYLTDDNKLVAYVEGRYISEGKNGLASVGSEGFVTGFGRGIDNASYTIYTISESQPQRAIYCNTNSWDRGNLTNNVHTDNGYDWVIEKVEWLPVALSTAAGYGTIYSPVALGRSDDGGTVRVAAYTGAVVDGVLKLTAVEGNIPQNTPVILEYLTGEENGNVFLQVADDVADATYTAGDGKLNGTFITMAKPTETSIYTLQKPQGSGIGMYKYSGTNLQGFRAYLPYTAPIEGGSLRMVFDNGTTTGIEAIEVNDNGKTRMYDLSGRRVQRMTRGFYIVNGKKVLMK